MGIYRSLREWQLHLRSSGYLISSADVRRLTVAGAKRLCEGL
jgi:hypothetical protein